MPTPTMRLVDISSSSEDPFSDPTDHAPPPVPVKDASAAHPSSVHEALRDVVQINKRPVQSPAMPSPPSTSSNSSVSRRHRRSQTIDPGAMPSAQAAQAKDGFADAHRKPKKPGKHFDVIDSLDYSSVLGTPLWHHDSPYDAAAPSRNKHQTRAPMRAFDSASAVPTLSSSAPYSTTAASSSSSSTNKHLSPLAAATLARMDAAAERADEEEAARHVNETEEEREARIRAEKKKSNPLLEVWGKHEEEPWEQFAAGAPARGDNGLSSRASSIWDVDAAIPPQPTRRPSSRAPPPAPIDLSGTGYTTYSSTSPSYPAGATPSPPLEGGTASARPKRSQSLLQKFRKARKNPNVPLGSSLDDEHPAHSPTGGSGGGEDADTVDPTLLSPRSRGGARLTPDYVHVSPPVEKDLPGVPAGSPGWTPRSERDGSYFPGGAGAPGGGGGGAGLGRKTSLLNKVRHGLGKGVRSRSRDSR